MSDKPHTKPPTPPSQPVPDENVVERRTLRDYYIILRERLWIALPLALIVSVGLGYSQARQTPLYQATATMQFEKPETVVTSQGVVDPTIRSDLDMNTTVQVLTSNMLRTRVIESLTPDEQRILQRPALKKLAPGQPPPPAAAMLGNVSVDPIRNSFLIRISDTHEDGEAAALIANRYVEQFMRYMFENTSGGNADAVQYLHERAEQLRKEAAEDENKLEAYMKANNLISLDKSIDIVTDRVKSVNAALSAAQLDLLSTKNLYQQVMDYKKSGKDLLEISYIASHGSVPTLKAQLTDLLQTQSILAERYLERHPKMIDVSDKIGVTQDNLARAIDLAIADLSTRRNAAEQSVAALQADYATQEAAAHKLRSLSGEFGSLQSKAAASKSYYMEILDRLNQTTTTKNLEKIPLHPLDRATIQSSPISPNISKIIRTNVGIGVLIFLGVAIGLSFVDDRIKSAWDVEAFIGVNLLGIIPDLSSLKDEEKYALSLDQTNGPAPGSEAFLGVYSATKIHSKLDYPKSILITSTIPGEGKTLVSCNLAACFARHGKRTLLIDCDLRRPMLHRHFKQQNTAGLITWFEGGASLEGDLGSNPSLGIVKVGENLSLLCSGGRSKSPTELLEMPVFGQLLEKMKKQYDLVVIDSPPIGAVTDALLIAERTDEVIYVCRFNRAFRKHIRLYIKALKNGKNDILGIVLNGLSPRRIEYYSNYRYYRSYKKYYGAQT